MSPAGEFGILATPGFGADGLDGGGTENLKIKIAINRIKTRIS